MTKPAKLLRVALVALGLALPIATSTLSAAQQQPSSADASQRADALNKKAVEALKKDRFAEAEPLAKEAWSLKQSYDIASNLGLAELGLGKHRDAAEHLRWRYAQRTFPANGKPEHRTLVDQSLAKARAQVGELTVHVSIERAEILVNGKSAGPAPLADVVFVEAGPCEVVARLEGYPDANERFDVARGQTRTVELKLAKPAGSPGVGPVGTGGPAVPGAPEPDDRGGPNEVVLIAGYGLTAVGLGLGITFALVSSGKASDADTKQSELASRGGAAACDSASFAAPCADLKGLRGDADTFGNASVGAFVAAGVLGVGTTAYWIATRKSSSAAKAGLHAVPVVGPSSAGLVAGGTF